MTAVKVGDRVRATCGESVIVGAVTRLDEINVFVEPAGIGTRLYLRACDWTVEVLVPPIPDVVGTIVRDRDGDAWQCRETGWYLAHDDDIPYSLDYLRNRFGPFDVLWTPEAKAP